MRLRGREVRDQLSRILGVARPFRCQPPRPRLRLRDVRGYVAQPISRRAGLRTHHAVRRTEDARKKKLLRPMRDAPVLRTRERTKVGEHSPRTVFGTHGPRAALPLIDPRESGLGLYGRASGAAEGLPRCDVGPAKAEEKRRSDRRIVMTPIRR